MQYERNNNKIKSWMIFLIRSTNIILHGHYLYSCYSLYPLLQQKWVQSQSCVSHVRVGMLDNSLTRKWRAQHEDSPPLDRDIVAGFPQENGFESEFNPAKRSGIVPVLTGTVGSDLVPSTAGMVGKDGQHHTGHSVVRSSHAVSWENSSTRSFFRAAK